jgi:hypothetical protein
MSSPLPEDYYTLVPEMDTDHILKSTLTGESRQQKGDSRTCLFCGFNYFFRPIRVRYHLGLRSVSKKVQKSNHLRIKLESGQSDDAVDVEKFGKRPRSSDDEITLPFQKVRKREEVDLQWTRAAVSAGLPMSFFDNPEVRKAVLMTAECGQRTWGR